MKRPKLQDKLVAQLRETPIVQIACKRTGVSRATYYRWRKDDKEFAKAADAALAEGTDLVNDMAESQLLTAIRDGNMTGIIYWLKHNHSRYATRLEVSARHEHVTGELTEEQAAVVTKALALAGLPKTNLEKEKNDEPTKPTS